MIRADSAEEYLKAIENISIDLNKRKQFKQTFMDNYKNQSIVNFIEEM